MAQVSLDDGGWGAIASNFANALAPDSSKRAQIYLQGAQYQKLLLEQEEKRRKMEAIRQSIENYPSTLPPNASMPLNADGTPAYGPASPDMQREHTIQRQQRIADNAAATSLAESAADFAKGVHGNRAFGEVAASGVPRDPRRQDVLQTLMSGVSGSLPTYSTTPHTYQPTDASGTAVGPAISSRRIPEGPSTMVSPTKAGPTNYFENDASADQRLFQLSQKAARDPGNMSIAELEEANVHLQNRFPVKNTVQTGPDGSKINVPMRERPMPETFNPLVAQIAELNAWKASRQPGGAPMPAPAAPAAVTTGAAPSPDATVGGLAGGAPAVPGAAAPGAPAVAPVVPGPRGTVGGLPVGSDIAAPSTISAGDATPIRKEFNDQVPVKSYFRAITPYKQFVENIKVATPQADVSMIYNLAKMLDPDSVVREGEMLIWKKSGGPFDQLQGLYDKVIADKAALNPKVRANLADMAERVMGANHAAYKEEADRFRELATQYGIDPSKVVPKNIPDLPKIDRKQISSIKPEGPGTPAERKAAAAAAATPTAPAGAAPAPAGPRPRTIRVNPRTGQIEDVP